MHKDEDDFILELRVRVNERDIERDRGRSEHLRGNNCAASIHAIRNDKTKIKNQPEIVQKYTHFNYYNHNNCMNQCVLFVSVQLLATDRMSIWMIKLKLNPTEYKMLIFLMIKYCPVCINRFSTLFLLLI